jgi:hypothetical protein
MVGAATAAVADSATPGSFPAGRLFLTCWLIYAVHWAPFLIREEFGAVALATRGSLNVQRFVGWTDDIFPMPDGRAFINNNPGASIAGAIPLLVARPVLEAVEAWNDSLPASAARATHAADFPASPAVRNRREWYFMLVGFLTAAGVMATTSALAVTALARTLWAARVPAFEASVASLTFGFATPVFVRSGYLNHNLLVGHAGLLAALALWNRGRADLPVLRAAAAGALAGFAVLCDYSGAIVLGVAGAYAWLRGGDGSSTSGRRMRTATWFVLGAAPMLFLLAWYQRWAFGHAALPSQNLMPAIAPTSVGYRGFGWPSWRILLMNYFDPRFGLFAVCPLLLAGVAAPFVRGGRYRLPRRETGLAIAYFAALTLFCASNRYSPLQAITGIRYLVPAIPVLVLLSLQVLQRAPSTLRMLVLLLSFGFAWIPAVVHRSLPVPISRAGEFQLSWIRRLSDYGALTFPEAVTWLVLLSAAAAIAVIWRPALAQRRATTAEAVSAE